MKTRMVALAAFAAVSVLQTAAPLGMIARREQVLRRGERFLFRTQPVDPSDAFRGRYVRVSVDAGTATRPEGVELDGGRRAYVALAADTNGFARLGACTPDRPREGSCIAVRVLRVSGREVSVQLPLDRFYMNERLAPEAERAYRDHSRDGRRDAALAVRVRRGYAVIEDLLIGGKPIGAHLRETAAGR